MYFQVSSEQLFNSSWMMLNTWSGQFDLEFRHCNWKGLDRYKSKIPGDDVASTPSWNTWWHVSIDYFIRYVLYILSIDLAAHKVQHILQKSYCLIYWEPDFPPLTKEWLRMDRTLRESVLRTCCFYNSDDPQRDPRLARTAFCQGAPLTLPCPLRAPGSSHTRILTYTSRN